MLIQVGIGNFKELDEFLKLGADEFYAGIVSIPNHVENAPNFVKLNDFIKAKKIIGNKKLFFVANEVSENLKNSTDIIEKLYYNKIDGFILKDISLMQSLKKRKIKPFIILSTLSLCLNSYTLNFFKKNYNIKRIALPEQILPYEAKNIIKQIETEMFPKHREICKMFNGICFLDCHGMDTTACMKTYIYKKNVFRMTTYSLKDRLLQFYQYYKLGTKIIKIGRSPLYKLTKILFSEAKAISDVIKNVKTEDEFLKYSIKIANDYNKIYKKLSEKYRFIW